MKQQSIASNYLNQYGQAIDLSLWPDKLSYQFVLILPVCGESLDCLTQVLKHQAQTSLLVILVVNRPAEHEKSNQWRNENQLLIKHLTAQSTQQTALNNNHCLLHLKDSTDILLLDFNDQAFSNKHGVGLARKIAADTALQLMVDNHIKKQWLFNTDADVILPCDYFKVINHIEPDCVALSLDFNHISDEAAIAEFQKTYDFKLHYYRLGIRFIGAEYDYIPLGSTLIVNANAYAKVRGFPIRSGAEDFYILNKLAKIGRIAQPKQPIIDIQVRYSDRVPFGTGPGINKIQQNSAAGDDPVFYHPEIFHVLKAWRQDLIDYYHQGKLPYDEFGLNAFWQINKVLSKAKQQCKTTERWNQFIHEWFDAFKLLKSVHFLMNSFKDMNLSELQESLHYKNITKYQ